MIPGSAVGAIHRLAFTTDTAEALELVAEAIRRGADPDEALDALALWRAARAADIHRLGGDAA